MGVKRCEFALISVISTRIRRVLAISLLRVVFDAWHSVAVDARKTKEYFEVGKTNITGWGGKFCDLQLYVKLEVSSDIVIFRLL